MDFHEIFTIYSPHKDPQLIQFSNLVHPNKALQGSFMYKQSFLFTQVWRINTEYNVLYLTGPYTPGPTHCYTRVMDSRLYKHRESMLNDPPHMPTFYPDEDTTEPLPDDIVHEDVFKMDQSTITFEEAKS